MQNTQRHLNVLYVEDDATDIDIVKATLNDIPDNCLRLSITEDGEEALKFLNKLEQYQNVKMPDLILLDLNLPKIDGKEILKSLKSSERHKHIPVIVLTTSIAQKDVDDVFKLGASGFITKPGDFFAFKEIFHTISDYWARKSKLPQIN